jgi:hypothetical protein
MKQPYELEILMRDTISERMAEAERERLALQAQPPRAPVAVLVFTLIANVTHRAKCWSLTRLARVAC